MPTATDKPDITKLEQHAEIKRRLPAAFYHRDEQERLAAALIDLLKVRKGR